MKAILSNYRQSPRKVRLVADVVKNKTVASAMDALMFVDKRASDPIRKLIASALSNAKNLSAGDAESLIIKEIRVDAGTTMKRSMPRARGSAFPIKKRTCSISIVLAPKPEAKMKPAMKTKAAKAANPSTN